ncbi:flagellar hook-basal body protein [Bacillus sp. B15-48]|uniref:flagellar hook-basal body protein n=1 Tax=Bacillus sp. B15-48 TaxID=1548601 RepID=UPI00193F282E|nr:flagellar hook-basal body protein [Bacillus sp. B15-48]MBM4764116.1 flagellar hook-basal body complex protein [Bacillus sp. B15-48]
MNTSFLISTTGIRAYQGKLDTIANNISNVDTAGFKRREAAFADNLTVSIQNQPHSGKETGRLSPDGIRTTFGSRLTSTSMELTQGAPKETNQPLDLMIEGSGFFRVQRTNGEATEILYTRNGNFQPLYVGEGQIQLGTPEGDVLLDGNGNPIVIANAADFQVESDGTITGSNQRVAIFTVDNPQLLKNEGGAFSLNGANPMENDVQLRQGFLESANVDLGQEMTDVIKAQRGLQANARALSYADQMMGIANGIIRS